MTLLVFRLGALAALSILIGSTDAQDFGSQTIDANGNFIVVCPGFNSTTQGPEFLDTGDANLPQVPKPRVFTNPLESASCLTAQYTKGDVGYKSIYFSSGLWRGNCLAGRMADGNENCMDTPSGFYKTGLLDAELRTCSPGYRCPAGSSSGAPSTAACPAGTFCWAGQPDTMDPWVCGEGTYSVEASGECLVCPELTFNNVTGQGSCMNCQLGYVHSNDRLSCSPCPAGSPLSRLDGVCSACSAGSYQANDAEETCLDCGPGFYCDATGSISQTICAAGFFCSEARNQEMLICPAGSYCPQGTVDPITCPLNTLSDSGSSSAADCQACTTGQFVNSAQTGCEYCPDGTYFQNSATIADCVTCGAGFICTESNRLQCPAGFFCQLDRTITAESCPAGSKCPIESVEPVPCTGNTVSGPEAADCTVCPDPLKAANVDQTSCEFCEAGYYANHTNPLDRCLQCGWGDYCIESFREVCPAGYACGQTGELLEECVPGNFCPAGSALPSPCSGALEYTDQPGQSVCQTCSPGSKANALHTGCEVCSPGQYFEASINDCAACQSGFICDGNDQILCPAGTFCPDASMPVGQPCPTGSACPEGSLQPIPCTGSTYTPDQNFAQCMSCPAKTIVNSDNTACDGCADGEFYIQIVNAECRVCEIGFYCVGSDQLPCPAGYYCPNTGMTEGFVCSQGNFCPEGTASEIPCDARSVAPGPANSACQTCAGDKLPDSSRTLCEYCTDGSFLDVGLNSCVSCPAGSACTKSVATECPVQSYQDQPGQAVCMDCVFMQDYCPGGAVLPVACSSFDASNMPEECLSTQPTPTTAASGTTGAVKTTLPPPIITTPPPPPPFTTMRPSSTTPTEVPVTTPSTPEPTVFNPTTRYVMSAQLQSNETWRVEFQSSATQEYISLVQRAETALNEVLSIGEIKSGQVFFLFKDLTDLSLSQMQPGASATSSNSTQSGTRTHRIKRQATSYVPGDTLVGYQVTLDVDRTQLPTTDGTTLLESTLNTNIAVLQSHGFNVYGKSSTSEILCLRNCGTGGLSTGAWIGIGIGIALTVIAIFAVIFHCYRRRREAWFDRAERKYTTGPDETDSDAGEPPLDNTVQIRRGSQIYDSSDDGDHL